MRKITNESSKFIKGVQFGNTNTLKISLLSTTGNKLDNESCVYVVWTFDKIFDVAFIKIITSAIQMHYKFWF